MCQRRGRRRHRDYRDAMTDETEKLRLIEALAKVLLAASEAMERSDWSAVEKCEV